MTEFPGYFFSAGKFLGQGPSEFESDTSTTKRFILVVLAGKVGVDDGQGGNRITLEEMVVGNDQECGP